MPDMSATELVHLGHACVVVDTGGSRILLDPGAFSEGWQTLEGLDAILVTHQHFDHLDVDNLPAVLRRNPEAQLIVDRGTAEVLVEKGIPHTSYEPGDEFTVSGTRVEVVGAARGEHAVIHPDIPVIPNNGYVLRADGGTVMHPGDAYVPVPDGVDVLLLPTGAPWLKVSEAVDYLRAQTPPVAVPIHEAVLANPALHYGLFDSLSPKATDVRVLERAVPTSV
jgi:L-ascorbate metabolism protein UlaG (beta-lactamase superfamily)